MALSSPIARWRTQLRGAASTLRIGVVADATSTMSSRMMGVQLGLDEARHAATLFGGRVELVSLSPTVIQPSGLSAIIGGSDAESCAAHARIADAAGVPFMNVGCIADTLRGAGCHRTTFHVIPSDAMYHDALRLAKADANTSVTSWDASLERFGADTLNQRFRTRFDEAMTSQAWAGWFAVKVLWEGSLRAKSVDPNKILEYLERDTTQFDGHKGRPLSFRQWDHQLRQPVYVIGGARPALEVPSAATGDESARESLDRIGTTAGASSCRLRP